MHPLEYRSIKFVKSSKPQVYEKCHSSSSVFMHFASSVYLPSFSLNIDSGRYKASKQQATTQTSNYLTKVNNRNTVTRSGMYSNLTIKRPEDVNCVFIVNFIVNFTYSFAFIVNSTCFTSCTTWNVPKQELYSEKKKRKKSNKFNRLQIEVFFLPNISPQNIGPSNFPLSVYTPRVH